MTRVYAFGEGGKDITSNKQILGGKGVSLALMTSIGLPVPPGFTITCPTCNEYTSLGHWPEGLEQEVFTQIEALEKKLGKKFGDNANPLLLSIRSGAAVSMPGMMDTILNLGLNDDAVEGLAKSTGQERFAYDSYRRFIQMFSDVVMGVPHEKFEHILDDVKDKAGAAQDVDLSVENLKDIISQYREMVKGTVGRDFPAEPKEQLRLAVNAVFDSWNNDRAIHYRAMYGIPGSIGTAVNVQSMVFGNTGERSGTGVGFTRDPSTGEKYMYGEFLPNAQGEDVVAGIRTPINIEEMPKFDGVWPSVYNELKKIYEILESHYKDMVDLEFTVEDGKVFMLQSRVGKRTAAAMVKIAVDMVEEGLIDKKAALVRMEANKLTELLFPTFDPKAEWKKLATGLPASPGAACGSIVFTAEDAVAAADAGKKVILVRRETSPEDLAGMEKAQGILTARGGVSSHAGVVARGMGKCCVCGCGDAIVDGEGKTVTIHGKVLKEGDFISLNGSTGEVAEGAVATIPATIGGNFKTVLEWADEFRTMGIRTNADTPRDALRAVEFGAEGIGLTRTEHMFFEDERIPWIRRMILAESKEDREGALAKLLPFQRGDFEGIFRAMEQRPVIIRLLDPPLHEFLPQEEEHIVSLAKDMGVTVQHLKDTIDSLHEVNPMLGFRGCRLGVVYPEISLMQVRAIMEAACIVKKEGVNVHPEIMVPIVCAETEMKFFYELIDAECKKVLAEHGLEELEYMIGTMIELPRAALLADKIAEAGAAFFSFGTNDLHQTTFGISRDDGGRFIPNYVKREFFKSDPFQSLDVAGVGQLIDMAVQRGRSVKNGMEIGVCGEHGGDPASIEFCQKVGLTYVSCSPFRVPVARLAAAIAAIKQENGDL